jgi:hypothetical protein
MSVLVFNVCILIGWLMFAIGGVWAYGPAWIAASGVFLVILTFLSLWLAGGLIGPKPKEED